MEVESNSFSHEREELFDNMERFKKITWAPKRDRSQSMFARLSKKRALNPKRLSFSAPFEDEGEDGVLAQPIEYPVAEMSTLHIAETEPQNATPVNRKIRSCSEVTPTDFDQMFRRRGWDSRERKGGMSGKTIQENCVVQAKRRIRLDTDVETKLKVMCKNVR